MFFKGSRYAQSPTYTVTLADGRIVTAVRPVLPGNEALQGFHKRLDGQRLDLIASHYLLDPTMFWRLCDINNAVLPDALATRDLVGIPERQGSI